jgi:VWFA-related protein
LDAAIQRVQGGGSTAIYNAVYIALRQLEKLRAPDRDEIRREVIVVLSDGEDTSSLVSFDELIELARRSQTVVYTIGLGLDAPASRFTPAGGEFALRRLAQETGGRLFMPRQPADLSNVYAEIADELTSQYVLGYLSSNGRGDSGWRSIAVRVSRPSLHARTRMGYYAPTPSSQ